MKVSLIILALVAIVPVAALSASSSGLTNIQWQLQTVRGDSVPPRATLRVAPNGAVDGRGWCNAMGGRATIGGDSIAFEGLISTMRACADARLTRLEGDYLAALREVARWRIERGRLHLSGKSGGDLLVFSTSEPLDLPPAEESPDAS